MVNLAHKAIQQWLETVLFIIFLAACSPIDSTKPFNDQQAIALIQSNYIENPAKQSIEIQLPKNQQWHKISDVPNRIAQPIIMVRDGQDSNNWIESIRTRMSADSKMSPTTFVQIVKQQAKKDCQEISMDITAKTADYQLYRLEKAGCMNDRDQIQIGKVMKGEDALYSVYYSAIKENVADAQIIQMSQTIAKSRLVENPFKNT